MQELDDSPFQLNTITERKYFNYSEYIDLNYRFASF